MKHNRHSVNIRWSNKYQIYYVLNFSCFRADLMWYDRKSYEIDGFSDIKFVSRAKITLDI